MFLVQPRDHRRYRFPGRFGCDENGDVEDHPCPSSCDILVAYHCDNLVRVVREVSPYLSGSPRFLRSSLEHSTVAEYEGSCSPPELAGVGRRLRVTVFFDSMTMSSPARACSRK